MCRPRPPCRPVPALLVEDAASAPEPLVEDVARSLTDTREAEARWSVSLHCD